MKRASAEPHSVLPRPTRASQLLPTRLDGQHRQLLDRQTATPVMARVVASLGTMAGGSPF